MEGTTGLRHPRQAQGESQGQIRRGILRWPRASHSDSQAASGSGCHADPKRMVPEGL